MTNTRYNPKTDKMPLNLAFFDADKNKILELYSDYITIHISGVVRFTLRTINDNAPLNAIGEANYVQVIQHHGAMQSIVDYRVVGQVSFDNASVVGEYDSRRLKDWNFSFLGEQRRKWSCLLPLIEVTKPKCSGRIIYSIPYIIEPEIIPDKIRGEKDTYGGNTLVFDAYTGREAREQLKAYLYGVETDDEGDIIYDEDGDTERRYPDDIAKMLLDGALIISK